MRTTLVIDDDILETARALAEHQGRSIGSVISDLARRALRKPETSRERNGVPLLPPRANNTVVTTEMVNRLRDELP